MSSVSSLRLGIGAGYPPPCVTRLTVHPDEGRTFQKVTAARLISPDTRSALVVALGAILIAIPIVVGLSLASIAASVVIGVFVLGLGLAGTAAGGRGTIPVSTQMVFDQGLAIGLLLSGLAFAFAGDTPAVMLFGLAGLAQLSITAITRYSAPPATQDFL